VDLEDLLPDTLAWIDAQDAPFFVLLQPMDVHALYNPGEEFLGTWSAELPFDPASSVGAQYDQIYRAWAAATSEEDRQAVIDQVRAVYDEDILSVDHGLDALMSALQARGHMLDTLVVVAGDHGETIGEDPVQLTIGHGQTTRRELVRVPLMFHHPRLPSQAITCLSQNTDVMPTILRAVGLTPMADTDGHPLQDGCRDVVTSSTFQSDLYQALPGELHVTDGTYALRWNCVENVIYQHDYAADPTGVLEAVTWPTDGALEAAMATFHQALIDGVGSAECAI
jgi:arylsulfatase A-like enzyme